MELSAMVQYSKVPAMSLPTTIQVSGAGSDDANGTYVRSGSGWRQPNGVGHWTLDTSRMSADRTRQMHSWIAEHCIVDAATRAQHAPTVLSHDGWYLSEFDGKRFRGMYYAEGASTTFPTTGWQVYTGPSFVDDYGRAWFSTSVCSRQACAPAPRFATEGIMQHAVVQLPKISQADMQHAVVQLPKVFKDRFTWDFVKEVVFDKVKDHFFDVLLAPFGLHGLAKTVVVEVINGVCHIYYRKVVEKKPISRSFLVDTVKEALQTSVRRWGLDVVVGDLFGKTVKDEFNNCTDTVQAAFDVAKDELEYAEKSLRYGDHYYRVLDDTHPDEEMLGTQSEALQIPMGWEIVTETADIVANVIACHKWGTHIVVFGNGKGYQTALVQGIADGRKAGAFWRENLLTKSGPYYKPNNKSLRILIRQRA